MSKLQAKGATVNNLVIQASTTDITNVKGKSRNEKFKVATESSINMVKIAEETIDNYKDIEKLLIIQRPPRVDEMEEFSQLSNEILKDQINKSKHSDKILYGQHDYLVKMDERDSFRLYGSPRSPGYDGIHMRGTEGSQLFMTSILNIFKEAKLGRYSDWKQTNKKFASPPVSMESSVPTLNRFDPLNSC